MRLRSFSLLFLGSLSALAGRYPNSRFGHLGAMSDQILEAGFGMPQGTSPAATTALQDAVLAPLPNWRYFFVASGHDVLGRALYSTTTVGGVTLEAWLQGFVGDGGGSFVNVRP